MQQHLVLPSICLTAATILCCSLLSIHAFDRLVVIQRTQFEQAWRQDGRPRPAYFRGGLSWDYSLQSSLASYRCDILWVFLTPDWVCQDPMALRYHRRLRVSTLISAVASVVPVAGLLIWHWFH